MHRIAPMPGARFARDQLGALIQFKPAPGRWRVALHIVSLVAVAVGLMSLVVGPRLAMIAVTSAFIGFTAMARPIRQRAVILAFMCVWNSVNLVIAGLVVIGHPIATTIFLTLVTLVSVLGYNTFVSQPPGPMFMIIGPAIASHLPLTGVPAVPLILTMMATSVIASLTSLGIQLLTGHHPERNALRDARKAVDDFLKTSDEDPHLRATRLDESYQKIQQARLVIKASGLRADPDSPVSARVEELHHRVVEEVSRKRLGGAEIVPSGRMRGALGPPTWQYLVGWALSRASMPWLTARRNAAALVLATVLAWVLNIGHPYWAVMTTAIVLAPSTARGDLYHRAMARSVGATIGVGLFLALHLMHLHDWWLFLVTLVLVFLVQETIVINGALGAIFVTPMALLAVASGSAMTTTDLVVQRILETVIGSVAAMVVVALMGRQAPVMLVRRQFRRALQRLADVLQHLVNGSQTGTLGFQARRNLVFEQLQCANALSLASRDLPDLQRWSTVDALVNRCSYETLAACWAVHPSEAFNAQAMLEALQHLIHRLPPVSPMPIDTELLATRLAEVERAGAVHVDHDDHTTTTKGTTAPCASSE